MCCFSNKNGNACHLHPNVGVRHGRDVLFLGPGFLVTAQGAFIIHGDFRQRTLEYRQRGCEYSCRLATEQAPRERVRALFFSNTFFLLAQTRGQRYTPW